MAFGNNRTGLAGSNPTPQNPWAAFGLPQGGRVTGDPTTTPVNRALLRQPSGPGVVSAGNQGGMRDIMSRAMGGPAMQTWQQYSSPTRGVNNGRPVLVGQGTQALQTLQPQDVVSAMVADSNARAQAAQQDVAHNRQAMGDVRQATGQAAANQRGQAEQLPGRVAGVMAPYEQQAAEQAQTIRDAGTGMMANAQRLGEGNVEAAAQRRQEALAAYRDPTANLMNEQRQTIQANMQQQINNVAAQYAQMGLPINDPQTQAAIQNVRAQTASDLGTLASRTMVAYNDTMANLRHSYDTLQASVEERNLQAQQGAGASQVGAMVAAANHQQRMSEMAANVRVAAEHTRVQMHTLADQMELNGAYTTAQWLREESTYVSSMAPIVAWAMNMQQGQVAVQGQNPNRTMGGVRPNAAPLPNMTVPQTQREGTGYQSRSWYSPPQPRPEQGVELVQNPLAVLGPAANNLSPGGIEDDQYTANGSYQQAINAAWARRLGTPGYPAQ